MNGTKPVQVVEGLWWVGQGAVEGRLECNPYLLMQGDSIVLFDPGSVLDAPAVIGQITELTPISEIDAVVLSHQDPDLCSCLPILEHSGFNGVICCHERAAQLITFYGIASPFYLVNTERYHYHLRDGSTIRFLYAPYLHFPGSIMTYLPQQKTLISGDLFGAVTEQWKLYADEQYRESMKTFHESYMPSQEIMQSVMNQLLYYDIQIICPQHGSIITEQIREHIEILRNLPCGFFLHPVRKDLYESGGYIYLCSQVLKRYFAIFGAKAVREVFTGSGFEISYRQKRIIKAPVSDSEMWDEFFDQIVKVKGLAWVTIISPLVESLSVQYNVPLPKAFSSVVFDAQKQEGVMQAQYQKLENQKLEIEAKLHAVEGQLAYCPVTSLYNQDFFDRYMAEEMRLFYQEPFSFAFLLLSIDNLAEINLAYGKNEGNTTLQNLAYVIKQSIEFPHQAFRLEGGVFALYLQNTSRQDAIERANELKQTVAESKLFITPVTITIGLCHTSELIPEEETTAENVFSAVLKHSRIRLKAAQRQGRSTLVYESVPEISSKTVGFALLIDLPGLSRNVMQRALEQEGFFVIPADNGLQGWQLITRQKPDIIICELMVPKMSGFALRKNQLKSAESSHIPFILVSANKQEQTVRQSVSLGITNFFPKPVLLPEFIGVVKILTGIHRPGE